MFALPGIINFCFSAFIFKHEVKAELVSQRRKNIKISRKRFSSDGYIVLRCQFPRVFISIIYLSFTAVDYTY